MSVNVRLRNGIDQSAGQGGATEGDLRGPSTDLIDDGAVVDLAGGQCLVHQASVPAMTVVVDPGVVYIPNSSFDYTDSDSIKFWEAVIAGTTASRTVVIGANSSGQTRIDLICAYLNSATLPDCYADNIATLSCVAGSPGAGQPATPSNMRLLGVVEVVNGAVTILNAKITDARTQVELKLAVLPTGFQAYTPAGGATATLDLSKYNDHRIQLPAGNISVTFANGRNGRKFIVRIKQDGVGGRTVTFTNNANITWMTSDGNAPALGASINEITVLGFVQTGPATWDGYFVGGN